jgi:4-hydroxyphenylpyruvate dioxygenase
MADKRDNPMGTRGFACVEFAAPAPAPLAALFERMGFVLYARHKTLPITLYRQGRIDFLLNASPDGHAASFARAHGPSAVAFGMRVEDARRAFARACALGARPADARPETRALDVPALEGIGGSLLYLVDEREDDLAVYRDRYAFVDGLERHPQGCGLVTIDHLTHNVERGQMDTWAGFYEKIFNFHEIRYFDIKGRKTGLVSRAMTSPDGNVRIPINESADDKSQIAEYLREYRGEGIQHIALSTRDVYGTVESLRDRGVPFLDTPETYFDMVDERIPGHGEDLERMRRDRILIDADPETKRRLLLQIFTANVIGPIFFEIIQRKGNQGFGEGNFQALFEAMERDQERRGVL